MDIPYEKMAAFENSSVSDIPSDGAMRAQIAPPRVRHYFVFSLFSALCLCPATGLIALAYSLKSSAKADVKFHDKARLYSRRALIWNLLSVIFAVLTIAMVLIFCYYFNEMVKIYSDQMDDIFRQQRSNEMNSEINRMIQSLNNEN
ncbi:hypothetical protein I4U23_007173 [Adineta vaga]|nr:hypothetical protein I4U23_007173 [Adineta vaga]